MFRFEFKYDTTSGVISKIKDLITKNKNKGYVSILDVSLYSDNISIKSFDNNTPMNYGWDFDTLINKVELERIFDGVVIGLPDPKKFESYTPDYSLYKNVSNNLFAFRNELIESGFNSEEAIQLLNSFISSGNFIINSNNSQ